MTLHHYYDYDDVSEINNITKTTFSESIIKKIKFNKKLLPVKRIFIRPIHPFIFYIFIESKIFNTQPKMQNKKFSQENKNKTYYVKN